MLSAGMASGAAGRLDAGITITPSTWMVNQQQGSFTVTLSLTKAVGSSVPATLPEPATVDLSALAVLVPDAATGANVPVFAPFQASVAFPAGVSTETLTVPIVAGARTPYPVRISLGATLHFGSQSIPSIPGIPFLELYSDADSEPPQVTGVRLVTDGRLASAVIVAFSKPMAPESVTAVGNYRILSRPKVSSHAGFLWASGATSTRIRSFPIASASYDSATSSVTLTLERPVRASSLYEVSSAYPLAGHELTDTAGRVVTFPVTQVDGFSALVQPIPGSGAFLAPPAGPLYSYQQTGSPIGNLNPMRGFA
jgi:hypothetical protein